MVSVTFGGVLDPLSPREYDYVCDRCDRAVTPSEERSFLQLHIFPTVEAGERIKNADQFLPLCPACQRRVHQFFGELTWNQVRTSLNRTNVPPVCGRCGADGTPNDTLVSTYKGTIGPRRRSARLCEGCSEWFRTSLDELVAERTPYDGEWYRPPALVRAEAAVAVHREATTGPVRDPFERLREGDLVRVAAYRRGWRSRGSYISVTAWVERVLTPLRDGPPSRVELGTVEQHLSYPPERTRSQWTLKTRPESHLAIEFAGAELEVTHLSLLHHPEG